MYASKYAGFLYMSGGSNCLERIFFLSEALQACPTLLLAVQAVVEVELERVIVRLCSR